MTADYMFLLATLDNLLRLDILIWVVGIPCVILSVISLFRQYRQHLKLKEELKQLAKIQRHTIEYDLVLKTMKLCTWRIDVPTRTITFESDYRDAVDHIDFPPSTPLSALVTTIDKKYTEKLNTDLTDLLEGRIDDFREQFERRIPHSDRVSWTESFATVDQRDMNGRPLTIVGASMIIDKQKEIEQALIVARNHAEESDRLKSAFLANMSHEIRTPLNAIVGFSDVLPMAQSDEEREQLVSLIKKNNDHLLRLFDDMVNMSKLEAGSETVNKSRFELNALLAEVVERYAEKSAETGVQLRIEAHGENPQPFTDRNRLREILNQYVDNALKFTSKGSVVVGYDIHEEQLRIWVRDTGKGIPADRCDERLFERFVKVDDFVPGTGLGLSICRSMALSLGGKVGVESKLGEGSVFWVELAIG